MKALITILFRIVSIIFFTVFAMVVGVILIAVGLGMLLLGRKPQFKVFRPQDLGGVFGGFQHAQGFPQSDAPTMRDVTPRTPEQINGDS
jgi:hypothetical protein